ncbi:DNA polymerase zeta catalytic subunit, putative [Plasmodium ovale curtisi]|uniref:DNA polymerase n=1 Tax=Plasmodium ovale curtisi TaxID=864141 RepID=A0A1A8VN27_PLAOA|nr:DNA polymerase zeta catalytic subunit, putative [Plasmodium ovale curtisi]
MIRFLTCLFFVQQLIFDTIRCKLNNKKISHVCVIQILGLSPLGQSVCLYIHDFFPFFYVLIPTEEKANTKLELELCAFFEEEYGKIKRDTTRNTCVYNIERVKKKCIYGYNEESEEFLKIYFLYPNTINYFASLLKKKLFKNRIWDLYEVHINYMLHFLCMKNIYGCSEIYVDKNIFFRKEFFSEINFECFMKEEKWYLKKAYPIENVKRKKYLDADAPYLFTNKTTNVRFSNLKRETSYDIECDIKHKHILNEKIYSYEFAKYKKKWKEELKFDLPINYLDSFAKLWIKEKKRCKLMNPSLMTSIFNFENFERDLNFDSFDVLTERTKKLFGELVQYMRREEATHVEAVSGICSGLNEEAEGESQVKAVREIYNDANGGDGEATPVRVVSGFYTCPNGKTDGASQVKEVSKIYSLPNRETEGASQVKLLNTIYGSADGMNEDEAIPVRGITKVEKAEGTNDLRCVANKDHFNSEGENVINVNVERSKKNTQTSLEHAGRCNDKKSKCIASFRINNKRKDVIRYVYKKNPPKIKECYAIYSDLCSTKKDEKGKCSISSDNISSQNTPSDMNQIHIPNKKKEKKINIKYGNIFFLEILTEIKSENCYPSYSTEGEIKAIFYLVRDERLLNYYDDYNNCVGIIANRPFPDLSPYFVDKLNELDKEGGEEKETKSKGKHISHVQFCSSDVCICENCSMKKLEKETNVQLNVTLRRAIGKNKKKSNFENDNTEKLFSLPVNYSRVNIRIVENEKELIKTLIDKINFYSPISIVSYENDKFNISYINERCIALDIGNFYMLISKLNDHINFTDLNNAYNKNIKGKVIESLYKLSSLSNVSFENLCKHYLNVNIPSISKHTLYSWYAYERESPIEETGSPPVCKTSDTPIENRIESFYFPYRYLTVRYFLMRVNFLLLIYDKIGYLKNKMNFCKYIHVDLFSLINRGSQYIIESFLLKICMKYGYVLYSPSNKEIFDQRPILHTPLVLQPKSSINFFPLLVFDFQSLYPSIVIAFNICYSTCIGTITLKPQEGGKRQDEGKQQNVGKQHEEENSSLSSDASHAFVSYDESNAPCFGEFPMINIEKEEVFPVGKGNEELFVRDTCSTEGFLCGHLEEERKEGRKKNDDDVEGKKNFEFIRLGVKKNAPSITNIIKNVRSEDLIITSNNTVYVKKSKRKGICILFLEDILKTRIMLKRCITHYDKKITKRLTERMGKLKMILNVATGYIGANFSGRMPCVDISESIICTGKNFLLYIIEYIKENYNFIKVLYGDTDSIFLLNETDDIKYTFKIAYDILHNVNSILPSPMYLNFEKLYCPSLLMTKKRYFGFAYKNENEDKPVLELKGVESIRSDQCDLVKNILVQIYFLLYYFRNNCYFSYCCSCCSMCGNFFPNFFSSCKDTNLHKTYPCLLSNVLEVILRVYGRLPPPSGEVQSGVHVESDECIGIGCNSGIDGSDLRGWGSFISTKRGKETLYELFTELKSREEQSIMLKTLNFLYKKNYPFLLYTLVNFSESILKEEVEKIIQKNYEQIVNWKNDCCSANPHNILKVCLCVREINFNLKCHKSKCFCNIKQAIFFHYNAIAHDSMEPQGNIAPHNNKFSIFNTKIFHTHLVLNIKKVISEYFNKIYANQISYDEFIIYKKVKLGTYKGELKDNNRKVSLPPQAIVAKKLQKIYPHLIITYKEKIPFIVTKKLKNDRVCNSVVHPSFVLGIHKHAWDLPHNTAHREGRNGKRENNDEEYCGIRHNGDQRNGNQSNGNQSSGDNRRCNVGSAKLIDEATPSVYTERGKKLKEINYDYYIQSLIIPPLKRMLDLLPYGSINLEEIFYRTKRKYNWNRKKFEMFSKKFENRETQILNSNRCSLGCNQLIMNMLKGENESLVGDKHMENVHNKETEWDGHPKWKTKIKINTGYDTRVASDTGTNSKRRKQIIMSYIEMNREQNMMKRLNKICLVCANSEIEAQACQYAVHCKVFFKKILLQENISKNKEKVKALMNE